MNRITLLEEQFESCTLEVTEVERNHIIEEKNEALCVVTTKEEGMEEKPKCIKVLFSPIMSLLSKVDLDVPITCSHSSSSGTEEKRRIPIRLLLAEGFSFVVLVWCLLALVLPEESISPYCGGFVYLKGMHHFSATFFLLMCYGHLNVAILIMIYYQVNNTDFKVNDKSLTDEEIQMITKYKAFGIKAYKLIVSSALGAILIFLMVVWYPLLAEYSSPFASKLCIIIVTIISFSILGVLSFIVLAGVVLLLIYQRFERLIELEESIKQEGNGKKLLICCIQSTHKSICLEVEEINKFGRYLLSVGYSFLIAFISSNTYFVIVGPMGSKCLSFLLLILTYAGCTIVFIGASLLAISAQRSVEETRILDSFNLPLEASLRLLNFIKRLGGPPVGIQIWDFIITKYLFIKAFEAIRSLFFTIRELHTVENHPGCKIDKYVNYTREINSNL